MDKLELTCQELLEENERLKKQIQENNQIFSILSNIKPESLSNSNNQLFKLVFETARIGLAIVDSKGNFIECNPRLCEITGYSREELLNIDFKKITHPDDAHLDRKYFADSLARKLNNISFEKRYINKFGNIVWVNLLIDIIRDKKGEFIYSIAAIEDITEQKKLKQVEDIILDFNRSIDLIDIDQILVAALEEAEKLTDSEMGFFHFIEEDKEEINLKFWSKKTLDLSQFPSHIKKCAFSDIGVWIDCIIDKQPIIYNDCKNLDHERDWPLGRFPFHRLLITPIVEENKVQAIIGVANKKSEYKDLDLKIINILVKNIWGIVQRKKAELKLVESETNFRTFFDSIDNFLFVLDKAKNIIEINQSPIAFLGYTRDDLIGKNFSVLFHNKNIAASNDIINSFINGKNFKRSISLCSKRGRLIPVEITVSLGFWNKNEVFYFECKDISQLEYSEDKFSKVFHINPAICAIIDTETEFFIELNKTFYHKLKYKPKDVINKSSIDLLRIDNEHKKHIYNEFLINGRLNNYEINLSTKNGDTIPVLLSCEIVLFQGKKFVYAVALDITEIRATQEKLKLSRHQLKEAQEIAQIGHYIFNIETGYWENSKSLNGIFAIDAEYSRNVKGWLEIVHPDFKDEMANYLQKHVLTEHKNFDKEYKIIGINDSHEKWVYGKGILKFNQAGKLVEMIGTIQDITIRKNAEIKIEESENALKKIIKSTFGKSGQDFLDSMCLCLQQITLSDYTYIAESSNDYEISTLTYYHQGKKIKNMVYKLVDTPCQQVFNKKSMVFENGVAKLFPKDKILKKLGINAYAGTPVLDHAGHSIGIIVSLFKNSIADSGFINSILEICSTSVGSEIERTKSELKIRESELTLKTVFNNEPAMMLLLDENANIININKAGENIFDYNNNHILGIRDKGRMNCYLNNHAELDCGKHEECKNCLLCFTFLNTLKTGETINKLESAIASVDQKFMHTFLLSSSRVELDGKYKVLITIDDITDRKRMEQKLLENDFTLNKIFNSTPSIMLLIDEDLKISKMNRIASEISLIWNNESEIISCGEVINCAYQFNKSIYGGNESICQYCKISTIIRETLKLGKEFFKEEIQIISQIKNKMVLRTFLVSSSIIITGFERLVLLTLDEISDRKSIDEELLLSKDKALFNEERYKLLSNITFEGIMLHKDRVIVDVNNALTKMSGYSFDELIGQHTMDFLFPPEQKNFLNQKLTEEYSEPYESVLLTKDRNRISVEIESRYFKYNNERIRVSAIRDITERKLGEKKILQAIVQTEENERARFAQELHDGLGPILSNVQMYFQWLAQADENIDFVIEKGNISLKNAFSTLREISNNLSPHILRNFGVTYALNNFIETIAFRNIHVDFKSSVDKMRFDNNIEIALYRIITELINNSLKYSEANVISIEMNLEKDLLKTIYSDNGKGFDIKETLKNYKGFGIINIQNRIKSLQGSIKFTSEKNAGFKVEMEVSLF